MRWKPDFTLNPHINDTRWVKRFAFLPVCTNTGEWVWLEKYMTEQIWYDKYWGGEWSWGGAAWHDSRSYTIEDQRKLID